MYNSRQRHLKKLQSGFTIIEVMIVLAIASLIMVMVFAGVNQLRSHTHDSARRSYARGVLAAALDYQSNNLGHQANCNDDSRPADCASAPAEARRFITHYMAADSDPTTGNSYISTSTIDVTTPCHGVATPSLSTIYCWNDLEAVGFVRHDILPNVGQVLIIPTHMCGTHTDTTPYGDGTIRDAADWQNPGTSTVFQVAVVIGTQSGGYYCINS